MNPQTTKPVKQYANPIDLVKICFWLQEDPVFRAENLINPKAKKWRSLTEGEAQLTVVLQVPLLSLVLRAAYRPNFFSVWLAIGLATLVLQTKLLTE